MVIIHIKKGDESQFLVETTLKTSIDDLASSVAAIYNGRLKVNRICSEMEELAKYGTLYPPEILGLTEEQVEELKLNDTWGEKSIPSGGHTFVKDPIGRRNGKQPTQAMQDVLNNAIKSSKEMISKKLVFEGKCLTIKIIHEAINLLRGAVTIVYPMKLPPHDVIRLEFENIEDLSGTQASLEIIDPTTAQMWFCGKELFRDGKKLEDYIGKLEKCKVERDFLKEFPNKGNFESRFVADVDKILGVYDCTMKHPIQTDSDNEPGWDKTTQAALALIYKVSQK